MKGKKIICDELKCPDEVLRVGIGDGGAESVTVNPMRGQNPLPQLRRSPSIIHLPRSQGRHFASRKPIKHEWPWIEQKCPSLNPWQRYDHGVLEYTSRP